MIDITKAFSLCEISPLFISYRKAILPIQMEMESEEHSDINEPDLDDYMEKMQDFRNSLCNRADRKIAKAQKRQKSDYDKRHCKGKVKLPIMVLYSLNL